MAVGIALIIILGFSASYLFKKIKLPGLVGMLIVGILIGPYVFNLLPQSILESSGDLRKIALIVILLRAGFELHRDTLTQVGRPALLMSMIPAIFEIIGIALFAPFILNISYLEAIILGSILAAVSPAVVVPLMLEFMDRNLGTKKGIPTLILGASSFDVFVIVIFTIFLGMYGGESVNLWLKLGEIPISIISGIIVGVVSAYILYYFLKKYNLSPSQSTMIILGISILLTWFEEISKNVLPVASLLGVMTIGFIILEKSNQIANKVSQCLKSIWGFAELILFVLIGAEVNISVAWKAGLIGILVILTGLIFRSIGTYISLWGTELNWKEKVFCIIAYIPKATVQAAIGAIPLSVGVASGDLILAVAVLSILTTAPLGAIGIILTGEKFLK